MTAGELQKYRSLGDGELVEAILQGDQAGAAALLVDRCGPAFKHLVQNKYPMLGMEAGDLVGEVFLALRGNDWRALRDFRGRNAEGGTCRLETYVTVIAARLLWKKLDRAVKGLDWKAPPMDQESVRPAGVRRARTLTVDEMMDAVMALEREEDRRVLLLYKIQGRSAEEVAGLLGVSTACVYTRCTRALARLRVLLNEDGRHE